MVHGPIRYAVICTTALHLLRRGFCSLVLFIMALQVVRSTADVVATEIQTGKLLTLKTDQLKYQVS